MNIFQQDCRQKPKLFELIKAYDNAAAKRHLFWHRSEIHLKGWMDDTPLHVAVICDNLEMVQYLVQNGADVNASRTSSWPFPLNWAKSLAVATYLLDHGALLQPQALEYATRADVPEIIALLMDRGVALTPQSPQYLHCSSIDAMKVYLDHGCVLDGCDDHGRNLLHRFAWGILPAEFDFAYAHGVPWKQDLMRVDPYYFGKSGGRAQMEAHIRSEYPGHVARTVRDIKTSEIHFGHVTFAMPSALGGNAVIVWGYGERLARIEIRDGRWAVTCAVHVNVCNVRRFALDRNGDIVLPTADEGLLILDGMTLQLKRSIPLAEGLDFENIHYFPGRSLYMAHGGEPKIHLLSEAFEIIGSSHLQDYAMELCANIDESLVSILSSDNEAFHALYHFSAAQELTHIETFYFSGLGASFELAFSENGFVVTYEDTVVVYRFTQGKVEQCWQLPLAQYPSPYGMSFAIYLDENTLLVGKGKQLLRIDAQIPKIVGVATLDLSKHVMNLYLDATREFLIVRGGGLYLLKLDAIPWEEPPQDPS